MLVIFIVALALTILSIVGVFVSDPPSDKGADAMTLASIMVTQHSAAIKLCQKTACDAGPVVPDAYVNAQIRAGALYARGDFTSYYDPATRQIVTWMKPKPAFRGTVNFAAVSLSLRKIQTGESSTFGTWDATGQKLVPRVTRQIYISQPVPPAVGAVIPDRAPLIVNRVI